MQANNYSFIRTTDLCIELNIRIVDNLVVERFKRHKKKESNK